MKTGQKVRLRSNTKIAAASAIPQDAEGVVLCAYRLLSDRQTNMERLDVDFSSYGMLWGQPAAAFESLSRDRAEVAA
ncbi:MAG: hypothetical protein EBY21_06215 [Alphaproteobacteria bacterium]|nr:hypothetical protein [Alphaproteobacteria bacterium]